jgi:predicted ester cyclase
MAAEENKKLVLRVFSEVFNKKQLNAADEILAPNYVNYGFPGVEPGPEGFKQIAGMFIAGFPDINITQDEVIAEGDRVVTRGTCRGTNTGEFMGMPPTGKEVNFSYIDVWRVENGKLAENWVEMDRMTMMQQLGLVPSQEQTT